MQSSRITDVGHHRTNRDDLAICPPPHPLHGVERKDKRSPQVYRHHLVPLIDRDLVPRNLGGIGGVGYHGVNTRSEPRIRQHHGFGHLIAVSSIGDDRQHTILPQLRHQSRRKPLVAFRPSMRDGHPRPGRYKPPGYCGADPPRGARHQRHATLQREIGITSQRDLRSVFSSASRRSVGTYQPFGARNRFMQSE